MKVQNMSSARGNTVPNQFIITDGNTKYFQSYDSIIVKIEYGLGRKAVYLDKNFWDYSVTTGRYRNIFLGETTKETKKKIETGEYILTNLMEEYGIVRPR